MKNLKQYLEEYKKLTLNLIYNVKKNMDIEDIIKKRQDILEEINEKDFDKEQLKKMIESLDIMSLEEELIRVIKNEMKETKNSIVKLDKANRAQQMYNKDTFTNRIYFNAKI